jgi:hypothetical protein
MSYLERQEPLGAALAGRASCPHIPYAQRYHRGVLLGFEEEDFHPLNITLWRDKLLRISWEIPYYDDGGFDDGQPFEFVTSLGADLVRPTSWEVQDIGSSRGSAWQREVSKSKILARPKADLMCLYSLTIAWSRSRPV